MAALLLPATLLAQECVPSEGCGPSPDAWRFLADVEGQFRSLSFYAEALGMFRSTTPNPSLCRHYQGIARADGPDGTPYFLVTRSGNLPDKFGADIACDDSPGERGDGNLVVFRMASRDKNGERLRSNRLHKGTNIGSTPPPDEDVAAIYYTVVGGDDPNDPDPCMRPGLLFRQGFIDADGDGENDCSSPPPHVYRHPGGMQRVGNVLALAMDTPRDPLADCHALCDLAFDPQVCRQFCDENIHYPAASSPSRIMFFDVTDPVHPRFLSQFIPYTLGGTVLHDSDGLALTPITGGRYLMAVGAGFEGDEPINFYRSSSGNLMDPDLTWTYVDRDFDINDEDEDAHQSLHFLRQENLEGPLYLAASRGHPLFGPDHDKLDLIRVTSETPTFEPNTAVYLTVKYRGQAMGTFPTTGLTRIANLAAATGFYESPSNELIFYATEHDNDGPDGSVNVAEWRHEDIVRDDSPTLLPSIRLDGPFKVDEGSSLAVTGSAAPPVTRAFIQLFTAPDFAGLYPVVDFDDVGKDDYDDFHALEPYPAIFDFTFDHQAQSWKWYAPVGCSIQAIDHETGNTATLAGNGTKVEEPDLLNYYNDLDTANFNRKVDEIRFLDNCTQYYATPVALNWDLDRNGSYETNGTSVVFSAAGLDGPSTVSLPAEARHPAGGEAAHDSVGVQILNVPPAMTGFSLRDGGGNDIGVVIPYVLVGLPVTAQSAFTDPGLPDHQTASLVWGDGAVDLQTAFSFFDEAFGDGAGALRHDHRYALPGTYEIALTVRDDDGGAGAAALSVRVVTPAQAVQEMLNALDDLIANTTDPDLKAILMKARKALAGSPPDASRNGALAKIRAGNNYAAIAAMKDALRWLQSAQSQGVDTGSLIAQVQQVMAALSTKVGRAPGQDRVPISAGRGAIPVPL